MSAIAVATTKFNAKDGYSSVVKKMQQTTGTFVNKANAGFNQLNRNLSIFNQKLKSAGSKLGKIGQFVGLYSAIIVLNRLKDAVLTFETGLVAVGKTTNLAGNKLKTLGNDILSTSKKLKTISTEKLLELASAAGQLGVTGSKNILKFSSVLGKLEKSSDIQGEEGAKAIARLLTITKEGVGIVDQFAASLVGLGNTSAASESEILSVASEVGRATAAYGLQSKEILGISAALKSLDVAPESAGSSVGKVFREIELATLKGGKSLTRFAKIMDISNAKVRSVFKDSPREAFSLFVKGLGRINDQGGSVAKSLIDVGLSGERVSKGIIPLAINYKLLEEKINLSNKAFSENVALNNEFNASQKTVKSGIDAVKISFENLFIKQATAGSRLEKVQNVLFFIADNMSTLLKIIIPVVAAFVAFKIILAMVTAGVLLANIAIGLHAAIMGVSAFAVNQNTIAYGAYRTAIVLGTAATWLFNAALAVNPIVWIVIGIIALVTAIILLIVYWDKLSKAFDNFFDKAGVFGVILIPLEAIWEQIKGIVGIFNAFKTEGFVGGMKAWGGAILSFVLLPLEKVLQALSAVGIAQGAYDDVKTFRTSLEYKGKETPKAVNTQATQEQVRTERTENNNNATLTINDNSGAAVLSEIPKGMNVLLNNTSGAN